MTAVGRRCSALEPRRTAAELEAAGDYVKFSKEKYILDSSPEKLHKELEEELKLSSTDLRSHAWYHGRIPREVSETLVQRNGDFLIRDSLTSLGDYVLTCRWHNQALHLASVPARRGRSAASLPGRLGALGQRPLRALTRVPRSRRAATLSPGTLQQAQGIKVALTLAHVHRSNLRS